MVNRTGTPARAASGPVRQVKGHSVLPYGMAAGGNRFVCCWTVHPSPTNEIRARSLRVAIVAFVFTVIFFLPAVVLFFVFVIFLVWVVSKEDIGSYRLIRRT